MLHGFSGCDEEDACIIVVEEEEGIDCVIIDGVAYKQNTTSSL